MNAPPVLALSLLAAAARQDDLLLEVAAPWFARVICFPSVLSVSYERFTKPRPGIALRVEETGAGPDAETRPLLQEALDAALRTGLAEEGSIAQDPADDKWLRPRELHDRLRPVHHVDSLACLELLQAERRGLLRRSRAELHLVFAERVLDLLGLDRAARIEFDERGHRWAIEIGRWGPEVTEALEAKYAGQREALVVVARAAAAGRTRELWADDAAAGIAEKHLASLAILLSAIRDAAPAFPPGRDLVDLAAFATRGHANRLGIGAVQDASIRWLLRRARGEAP